MSNPESAPILLEQTLTPLSELDPLTRKVLVQLPPPAVADNRADVDRLRHVLEHQVSPVQIPLFLMHSIPILCSTQEPLTATLAPTGCGWQLIELERGDTTVEHYGLAVDIGTTTVVVYLIDMHSGAVLQKAADFNAQIPFGEDILSRIRHAAEPGGLIELQHAIRDTLNRLIGRVCIPPLTPTRISAVSIGANTTMVHLLLGLDPMSISRAPYIPVVNAPGLLTAQDIGLVINPLAPVYCLPSVGSFIGGDIIAGVLVSKMYLRNEISLFVDIGTNGEIVMGNRDWLVACAGAAGPALEGGVTTHGMRAEAGAVDRVSLDPLSGQVHYSTIGKTPARGICGSGLVDTLAELFLHGMIDRAGQFATGRSKIIVVPAAESTTGKDIVATQTDIDNLMATKGAVNAAIDVLLESVDCSWPAHFIKYSFHLSRLRITNSSP